MNNQDPISDTLAGRFSAWIIRSRWGLLGIATLVSVVAYWPAERLDFDRTIENMFRPGDPLLPPYNQLQRTFGGDDLVLVAYRDSQLMTPDGIARVAALTERLAEVPGVSATLSLTTTPLGTDIVAEDSRSRQLLKLLEDYNVSRDRQTTAIACLLEPELELSDQSRAIDELRTIAQAEEPAAVIVGGPVILSEGFRLVEEDGSRLGWLSTILLGLTIIALFRSLRWMIAALIVVNATLLWTKALLELTAFQLSIVSSMLWSIITVVGIATVVHLLVRFREERAAGRTATHAFQAAGAALAAPVMWTCFTDAAGFASLLAANVGAVHDFGYMMAWGALLALLSLALFLPGLILAGQRDVDPRIVWGESFVSTVLRRSLDVALSYAWLILIAAVAVTAAAAAGCFRLEVESDFTNNFRAGSSIVRSYSFVEENLGGAGAWDVIVPAPPPERFSTRYLRKLQLLEAALRKGVVLEGEDGQDTPGLSKVLGLAAALDTVPTPRGFGRDIILRSTYRRFLEESPHVAAQLYAEDPAQPGSHFTRIMLRSKERQPSAQKKLLIEQVTNISRQVFPESADQPPAQVTGFYVLLANVIESMIRDQWLTFSIAAGAIGVMMVVAFRSVPLAAIALVTNVLPILLVLGGMGWSGYKINMGAVMIAAISIGLSVDAEIHYITSFRRLRKEGVPVREALHAVQQRVGRAVAFATVALVVGFGALVVSDFVPTIYFGSLVSLSMLNGLVSNIVVLPALLHLSAGRP